MSEKATVRDGWSELSTAIDQVVAERNKLREVNADLVAALEATLIAFGYDEYTDEILEAVVAYPNDPADTREKNRARAVLQSRAAIRKARGEQ
jgi:hypothetical protein